MSNDTGYLFMCLLAICKSFGKCLFKSFAHFWIRLSFNCWVAGTIYTFWISYPYEINDGLSFHSLGGMLWSTKIISLMKSSIHVLFLLLPVVLVSYLRLYRLSVSGQSEHCCLISDLRRKPVRLLLLDVMLAVSFSWRPFIMLREFYFIPSFLEFFFLLW